MQLNASETMNYDDAFTLEQVSEPLLDKFNFVAGIIPVLTTYLSQVWPRSCDHLVSAVPGHVSIM